MTNIVLTRIDNRLIHGQVATQWVGTVGANILIVANDEVSNDRLSQQLMNMAAPSYAPTKYYTITKTVEYIANASSTQKIAIIVETPQDVLRLVEAGVPIKKVNIGNMHMSYGKRKVSTSVAVYERDVDCFRTLQSYGVELEIQRVPSTPIEDVDMLFKQQ